MSILIYNKHVTSQIPYRVSGDFSVLKMTKYCKVFDIKYTEI